MLLSFSVPSMRPMIEAGLRQRAGENTGDARVKRQTIRALGPRNKELVERARGAGWTMPYDLHLWWKSRTAERSYLGLVSAVGAPVHVYPIDILHSRVEPTHAPNYPVVRICGPQGWRDGDAMLFWSPGDEENGFVREARADGFDSPEAFRNYFVPNMGDRFEGALFRW